MEFNPVPEAELRGGDDIVVLGRPESLHEVEAIAAVRSASARSR
jgi:hypothetical protein